MTCVGALILFMFSWRECRDFSSTISKNTGVDRGRISLRRRMLCVQPHDMGGEPACGQGRWDKPRRATLAKVVAFSTSTKLQQRHSPSTPPPHRHRYALDQLGG